PIPRDVPILRISRAVPLRPLAATRLLMLVPPPWSTITNHATTPRYPAATRDRRNGGVRSRYAHASRRIDSRCGRCRASHRRHPERGGIPCANPDRGATFSHDLSRCGRHLV